MGLDEAARARLVAELDRMKLRVSDRHVQFSTISDTHDGEKVAQSRPENPQTAESVPSSVRILLDLVARYAVAGSVSERVVTGVARLAGLTASESAEFRARATARFSVRAEPSPTESPARSEPVAAASRPDALTVLPDGLSPAVSAAMKVLDEDRFTERPEKRVLTAAEEVGLSVLLRGGAARVGVEPTARELADLSPQDIRRRARDCLIAHNQGLVHSIVRGYVDQGLEYADLFQHGVLGLINAVRKYDPSQGNKLSTYATWWIRQAVSRAVADEGRAIRVPVYMHDLMHKVARAERQLLSAGRSLSAADIAVACDLPITKVEEIRRISRVTDSLDRVIGDGTSLGELVETRTALPSVEGTVLRSLADRDVHRFVALLPERYAYVVNRRIGLDGQEPATLDVIGTELQVTRERVRQLEGQVFSVLRLALEAPAGDPRTALRSMLTDPRAGGNPVSGISRDLRSSKWSAGVVAMRAFHARKGHARPADDHVEGGFPLGVWAAEQRSTAGESGDGLPMHRKIILSMVGFRWRNTPDKPRQAPRRVPPRTPVPAVPAPQPSPSPTEPVVQNVSAGTDTPEAHEVPYMPVTPDPAEMPAVHQVTDVTQVPEAPAIERYSGRWEEAIELPVTLDRSVRWMAHYVRHALGHALLDEILGPHPARTVDEAADGNRLPDQPVAQALHVLVRVLDSLKEQGLRPEDFFECPSPALLGQCPRVYLSAHPPVKPEGRLALAQALKEFTPPDVTVEEPIGGTQPPAPTAEHRHQEAEHRLRELREAHEAADERIRNAQAEAEERVREVERVAALRVAAIEGRLREGQAAAFQRITAAETLERETAERMRAVERRAEQRVAEVQEASLSRIAELEAQLAALRPAPQAPPAIPQGPDPRKWWQQG
ncbi:sigma-70 family RNA polymerase sigma factor [Streptomyces sp. NBC_01255]|uniref:sigma-70 family RNA polymerase sigma factor n=1 Tax=Streptomyces sp. NBC_01255 TaxID=2903798 RepID=UPI002E2F3F35|nr:sigma-70 family RNA polymerase sigma factor [Streptomyces sp. NBC_01255]